MAELSVWRRYVPVLVAAGCSALVTVAGLLLYQWWLSQSTNALTQHVAADLERQRVTSRPTPQATYRPPVRWLELDGVVNARDIGGYGTADGRSVCWNRVYRSGELRRLTAAGCEAFGKLGIRRVVDFRNRMLLSSSFGGDAECVFDAAEMTLLAVHPDVEGVDHPTYAQILHANVESFRGAFELLADPANLPLMYHCAAGKDRTGIMTVLLLSLLGVDRGTIVQDYELSAQVAGAIATPEVFELFEEIDAQGGIENYLAGLGVSAQTQVSIREQMLE